MPSASYSEQAAILYPYLRKHLQSEENVSDPDRQDQLAFLFSMSELFILEYSTINQVP